MGADVGQRIGRFHVDCKREGHVRFSSRSGVTVYSRLWEPSCVVSGNLFLVHGFGSSTYAWEKIMPALLAAGYRVVAVEVPGFGYSDCGAGRCQRDPQAAPCAGRPDLGRKRPLGHALSGTTRGGPRQPPAASRARGGALSDGNASGRVCASAAFGFEQHRGLLPDWERVTHGLSGGRMMREGR